MAKKILLVDDDRDVVRFIGHTFRAQGYDVVSAHDGRSAVSTAQQTRPDLVVLDLGLPDGDGFWVMSRLAEVMGLVPVIVMSARQSAADQVRALNAGAQAFFPKPVARTAFMAAVRHALHEDPPS
jgi:two-component system KDP operon response regulator KdpE